jgi:hypothetical protein
MESGMKVEKIVGAEVPDKNANDCQSLGDIKIK